MATQAGAVNVRKAVGYAVIDSAGIRLATRKVSAYAVVDSSPNLSIRKAMGYVVLDDGSITLSTGSGGATREHVKGFVRSMITGVAREI